MVRGELHRGVFANGWKRKRGTPRLALSRPAALSPTRRPIRRTVGDGQLRQFGPSFGDEHVRVSRWQVERIARVSLRQIDPVQNV